MTELGFVDEDGDFPRSRLAFTSDAIATIFGSIFGLSPVTSYIESGKKECRQSSVGKKNDTDIFDCVLDPLCLKQVPESRLVLEQV